MCTEFNLIYSQRFCLYKLIKDTSKNVTNILNVYSIYIHLHGIFSQLTETIQK